jgi:hypothetical protein
MAQNRRMSPRAALALLLLSGCGDPDTARREALAEAEEDAGRVECAVDGAADFAPVCVLERVSGPDGLVLTLRAPSGSFRRLLVTTDGRGVAAADGADPAVVTPLAEDRIEVAIAGDRYRLPARVKK